MVEVLQEGNGTRETTCYNCGSRLRYRPSEVRPEERNRDYLGDYEIVRVITCPVCGETTAAK